MKRLAHGVGVLIATPIVLVCTLFCVAYAQDKTAAPTELAACYWQDALNAAFCDHTISTSFGIGDQSVDWKYQELEHFLRSETIKHASDRWNWLDGTGTIAATPLPWLKLSAGSQFEDFTSISDYTFTKVVGVVRVHPPVKIDAVSNYWLWQFVEANAKIYDSGPGDSRYFAHLFAAAAFVPDQSDITAQSRVDSGAEAGARWALSPEFAVNAKTVLEFDHFSYLDQNIIYPSARLLVSDDPLGVAIGPVYDGAVLTSSDGGVGAHPTVTHLGAEAVVQPMARADIAVLRGMIIEVKAEHNIGQADFLSTGQSTGMNYSASLALNFPY